MTEAMSCGTPVIARPLGAANEIVRDNVTGFLCDTVDEMVTAVQRCGSIDPRLCRTWAEERYSGDAMVQGYLDLYRYLVEGRIAAALERNAMTGERRLRRSDPVDRALTS